MFQMWLGVGRDAFNPRMQLNSAKAVLSRGDVEKLKNLKPLISDDGTKVFHWNDLYDEAVHWGVIDEGYFAQDLSKMTQSQGLLRNIVPGKYDPTSTSDFVAYKFATNVGGTWKTATDCSTMHPCASKASRLTKRQTQASSTCLTTVI